MVLDRAVAVKTELSADEIAEVARAFALGAVREWRGIPQGSINTHYELECEAGRFVLRLTEGRADAEVQFEEALLEFLAAAAYPVARPVAGPPGARVRGRPATLFHWVAGEEIRRDEVRPEHLLEIGRLLGRLHLVSEGFPRSQENRYSPEVILGWAQDLEQGGEGDDEVRAAAPLLRREAERAAALAPLPQGVVHADLFRDNVKWLGARVSAVLDWEMACTDAFVLDVAIALHAWCFGERFEPALVRALLDGYRARRKLSPEEREGFVPRLRFAAVRYALSRIRDFHLSPLPAERLVKKDWRRYLRRLQALPEIEPVIDAAMGG
jgi:homoserine kinase type II